MKVILVRALQGALPLPILAGLTLAGTAPLPGRAEAAPAGRVLGSIPAPGPCTTGLAWDGRYLWAADHKSDTLYRLDPGAGGKVVARLPSPGYRPAGLAWDGRHLWNADPEAGRLYRIDIERGVSDHEVQSPVPGPLALGWDGSRLWLAARRHDRMYRIDAADGTTVESRPLPPREASGLAFDGRYLWIADRLTDRIHMVHPGSGEVLFSLPAPGPHVTGLAFDGRHLWAADYQADRIYRLDPAGDTSAVRTAGKKQAVEYTHQLRNLGPGTLVQAEVYLAIPDSEQGQELAGRPVFSPAPQRTLTDQWGQRVAQFSFKDLGPGQFATVTMRATATLFDLQHRIYPHLVKRSGSIPADIRRRYLQDGDKLMIGSPTILREMRRAVGSEKNLYLMARKIYRHVHRRMRYELAGGWNVAPRVLQRGSGSCSEYSFVFIALCRAAGLPARYVGSLVVRKDEASYDDVFHRWVELYLPPYGWVPVDPSRGDKESEVERADAFGHLEPSFLVTTRGGGGSQYLGWTYNAKERWTCRGRCQVAVEAIAEWTPAR